MEARWISALFLLVTAVGTAQAQTETVGQSDTFRWSKGLTHELNYKSTIRTSKELSREQRQALVNAVLTQLRKKRLMDKSEAALRQLALDTRIEFVDLNGNGTKEVVAQSNASELWGVTGNCSLWIFQLAADDYQLLLDSRKGKWGTPVQVVGVLSSSTNGYRDIALGTHDSATETTLFVYKYANGRYGPTQCYSLSWKSENLEPLKNPRMWPCPGFK